MQRAKTFAERPMPNLIQNYIEGQWRKSAATRSLLDAVLGSLTFR